MNNILLCVEQVFNEKKLIGNHDYTEDEYSLMVDAVCTLRDNFDKNSYKLVFTTLVEIAKRWKHSDSTTNDDEQQPQQIFQWEPIQINQSDYLHEDALLNPKINYID